MALTPGTIDSKIRNAQLLDRFSAILLTTINRISQELCSLTYDTSKPEAAPLTSHRALRPAFAEFAKINAVAHVGTNERLRVRIVMRYMPPANPSPIARI